jgi:hypothetical protein
VARSIRTRTLTSLAVFVIGGVGGALLDQIHVRAHVLRYAHPDLAGQPWWVAPQFGIAVIAILSAAVAAGRSRRVKDRVPLYVDAGAFIAAYASTGVLHRHPLPATVALATVWVMLLIGHRDRARIVAISIILAIVGPVYESVLTGTGAFRYTVSPLVFRVPIWLPALYLNAGVLAAATARALASELVRAPVRTVEPARSFLSR